jgi:uncharacterized protein (TIGR02453 family)
VAGDRIAHVTAEVIDVARTFRFLRGLKKNNDRAWFAEHRAAYDEHIKPEWHDLVAGLLAAAVPLDERFAYVDPKACLFRLHRDTRFSSDKTPYKTGISAFLSPFGKSGANAGYYVALEPGASLFAAGLYLPAPEALTALRRHFAGDDVRDFERIFRAKRIAPYLPLETDSLTRSPRGFPKEHPHVTLIRARRYMVRRTYADRELATAGAFATFRGAMRDCAPLVTYLDAVVREA